MGIFLLVMLLFPGVCDLSSSVPRQFHAVKTGKTWAAAQQYCREKFTDLATIDNMADIEKIKRLLQNEGYWPGWLVWIGLGQGRWQWSLADEGFYGENETEFRNWGAKMPTSGSPKERNGEDCASIHSSDLWYNFPCKESFPFLCHDVRNSTYPYVLVEEEKNWTEAQRHCRDKHTDLASVRNQAEHDKLAEVKGGHMYVWIGLFRDAWEWSDSSSSSFRHWAPGEPNYQTTVSSPHGFCVELRDPGQWNDEECNTERNSVCYEDPPDLPTAKVVVVSPPPPFYSGDVVTLRCDIPEYADWRQHSWLKDNSTLPGKTSQTITVTLPLEAGQYQCKGERHDHPMTSSLSSSVDIISNGVAVPRQFYLVNTDKTWAAAQQHCREKFTDLATIDNMADIEKIKRLLQDEDYEEGWKLWTGLRQGRWQWSLADEGFYGENETEFRNWAANMPTSGSSDERDGEDCASIHYSNLWYNFPCKESYPFLCYDERNSTHPYALVEEEKNWTEAQRHCRDKHTDLASVRNQAENKKLAEVKGGNMYVWIGLFRDAWEWSDSSSSSFRHWAPGEPDYGVSSQHGLCGELNDPGQWNDEDCNIGRHSVCYEGLPNATVVVVSPIPPFHSGDVVTLRCDIPEYSDWHQYVWLKDNITLPGKTSQTIAITLPLEAGQYQCSGERNNRPTTSSVSSSVDIIGNALPNATVVVVSPLPPFHSGDVVTLRCDIPEYSDWHQYVWLKDNSPVPGHTRQTITMILPRADGQYQCQGERNNRPTTSSVSSSVDIISNDLPNATVVVMVSHPPPFYSGDVVYLECDIPEYTDWYQYVWLKDSTPLPGKTSQNITITLPLEAGQYQCKGERNNRPTTSSASSSVDIISSGLPNATVVVVSPIPPFQSGDDVTLRCDIPEYTDWYQYVWLKDSTPVPGKTSQTIAITLPLEAGQYQCKGQRNNRPMISSVSSSVDIISNALVKRTQVVRVEMEAFDDVDMEDPDVQKAVLQQIGDRLKANGFPGDVKLSWRKQADGKVFHKKRNDKKKEKRTEL